MQRGDEELAIRGFVFMQAGKNCSCFRGKAGPETPLVVASFESKRVVVTLCERRCARANHNHSHEKKFHQVSFSCFHAKALSRKVRRKDTGGFASFASLREEFSTALYILECTPRSSSKTHQDPQLPFPSTNASPSPEIPSPTIAAG